MANANTAFPTEYRCTVNAITGEFSGSEWPLGRSAPFRVRRKPDLRKLVRIKNVAGDYQGCSVNPRLEDGSVWVRAELFRRFGARVRPETAGLEVTCGTTVVVGSQVHSVFRDFGWWVPLRKTAESLGWKVKWIPAERTVVIDSPPPPIYPIRLEIPTAKP